MIFREFCESYKQTFKIFSEYWKKYGKLKGLVTSPYFSISVALTLLMLHYWLTEKWWETALNILPNIFGFSLGGYAVVLAFGDEKFREKLGTTKNNESVSAYLTISSTFAHFIIIQIIALILALLAKAFDFKYLFNDQIEKIIQILIPIGYGIGFFFFIYAILSALAATMGIFRISMWHNAFIEQQKQKDLQNQPSSEKKINEGKNIIS